MSNSSLTVAVHGVTGPQGAAVARALLTTGAHVRGIARQGAAPDGVEPVAADLLDADALTRAYTGADAVVVHLPTVFAPDTALAQADAVLHAVRRAGVRRLVVNPNLVPPPVEVGVPYLDARTRLARGLPDGSVRTSVVAPAAQYMENLNAPWSAPRVLDEGVAAYPLPADLPVAWVALADIADAVTAVLADPQAPALTVVAGPQALTGAQTAAALAAGLGRPVTWSTIAADQYRDMLAPHIGAEPAAGIAGLYDAVLSGQAPPPAPLPSEVVRTGTTTLEAWAARQPWPYSAGSGRQSERPA